MVDRMFVLCAEDYVTLRFSIGNNRMMLLYHIDVGWITMRFQVEPEFTAQ
jgi:hypothetical protein